MIAKSPSVIAILSGAMIKDADTGCWRTTTFDDPGDLYGAVGDRLRILAGSLLRDQYPQSKILLLGGKGQFSQTKGAPSVASVMKKELIELGVPPEAIKTEEKSGTTHESLLVLRGLIAKEKSKNIWLVSNRYHLSRIRAMIKYTPELKTEFQKRSVKLVSAEEVLIKKQPLVWKKKLERIYQTPQLKKRIVLEKMGVKDIAAGKYFFKEYEGKK